MRNVINNGGPAFPLQGGVEQLETSLPLQGMTLRDYFAAAALQGLLATDAMDKGAQHVSPEVNERAMAMACYALADAMLRARGEA